MPYCSRGETQRVKTQEACSTAVSNKDSEPHALVRHPCEGLACLPLNRLDKIESKNVFQLNYVVKKESNSDNSPLTSRETVSCVSSMPYMTSQR